MVKLIGKNKLNVAIFISGRGSNLKSLIDFAKKNSSPIKIMLVVSNNLKANGLNYAKNNNIDYYVIEPQKRKIIKKSYADNFLKE